MADEDEVRSEEEPSLAATAGDSKLAGISVSGVGGELLAFEENEAGLLPGHEQGPRLGWGSHPAADDAEEQAASNEGTGQSEKPDPGR